MGFLMKKMSFIVWLVILTVGPLSAQSTQITNPTERYAYPLALEACGYGSFLIGEAPPNLATDAPEEIGVYGGTVSAVLPLRELPWLQPTVGVGLRHVSAPEATPYTSGETSGVTRDWTNTLIELFGGAAWTFRLNKIIAVGADASGGVGLLTYPRVVAGGLSQPAIVAAGGIQVIISPLFNVGISVRAGAHYRHTIGGATTGLNRYDGLSWQVGGGVSFRLGSDPDREHGSIRAIEFGEPRIEPLFAAMQSYYAAEPVGTVTVTNVEDEAVTDLEVSFFQSGYMDAPTVATTIDRLEPGEERTVEFRATFNDTVFDVEGVKPLTGTILVQYRYAGSAVDQERAVGYELYDKTSITWDDDRKMGAFITPADSSIRSYTSSVRLALRDLDLPGLSPELQFAMQAYHALAERGMLYQPDPTAPFTEMQENTYLVDSVSLPRDTINRITGDCDDLTALYNTVLETRGVETAFVTTPGHIYSAVNLKVSPRDYASVHPDRDMTLVFEDEIWILVEITLIGREGFLRAWKTGMDEYRRYDDEPQERNFVPTRQAQETFRPVGLTTADREVLVEDPQDLVESFLSDRDQLAQTILAPLRERAEERNRGSYWNRYGIAAAELHQFEAAETAFRAAADAPGGNELAAQVNIGTMYFLRRRYEDALRAFEAAVQTAAPETTAPRTRVTLLLNLSRTYHALEAFEQAAQAFEQAAAIDPQQAAEYEFLATPTTGGDGARADQTRLQRVQFIEIE